MTCMHGISSLDCFKGFCSHIKIIALLELVNRGSCWAWRCVWLCCDACGNACLQLHLAAHRSTAPSSAAGSHPAQLLPGRGKKSSLVKSAFVKHGRFLTFLLVELFKGQILIDPPSPPPLFFYFSPAPLVSIPSPAPKVLQVGAECELHRLLLLTCTIYIQFPPLQKQSSTPD